jgi:hypothetical protein
VVEGGLVWVAFIGPEQRRDVEAGRWFGVDNGGCFILQCIDYDSGGEPRGGETDGRAIAKRRRGGGEIVSTVTLHDAVVHVWPAGGDNGWFGCRRGTKLD